MSRPPHRGAGWWWALWAVLALGCHKPAPAPRPSPVAPVPATTFFAGPADGRLHLYFLDVGRGASTLIVSPVGRTALIDGGPVSSASHLLHRLPELLHERPDWVIDSVPLPEHLGGLFETLRVLGAGHFLDPGLSCPNGPCQALRDLVAGLKIPKGSLAPDPRAPGLPTHIDLGGGVDLAILWPRSPVEAPLAGAADPTRANALVFRVSYGDTAALLESDAQATTESYLLQKRWDYRSTLLEVADHGGDRASTAGFLQAVGPRVAIIPPGPSGPPSPATLARLRAAGAEVFRVAQEGEIHAVSDGTRFTLFTERAAAGEPPLTPHIFSGTGPPAAPPVPAPPAELQSAPPAPVTAQTAAPEQPPHPAQGDPRVPAWARYVASRHSKLFHRPDCPSVARIKPDNLVFFRSRAQALAKKRPASDCHP